jgi:hypothetical protein
VRRVIEVLQTALAEAQRHVAQRAEHVPHVVKQDAADVFADKREAQLEVVKEQGVAA